MSEQSFADLGVSNPVVAALKQRGIDIPFAIQRLVVADVLAGRDVLAKSPTGSGKTLAFGIPIVERLDANAGRQTALILAPTRELATQIVEEIRDIAHSRALKIAAVYGGVGIDKQSKIAERAHIIVATPGRLEDLIQRGAVRLDKVRVLVLDEADRMLDMGFRPVVDRIVAQVPRDRQTLFFSATLDGEAGEIARAYTSDARRHEHKPTEQRTADVEHRFVSVAHEHKLKVLVDTLTKEKRELALVFVRTKRGADRLVQRLSKSGVTAVAMHGNKSQSQREKALARFEAFEVDVLVATDVAARGIDVDSISHVINFDPPEDREGYVHRVGRTARKGNTGIGITLVEHGQIGDMRKIASALKLEDAFGAGNFPAVQTHAGGRAHRGQGARSAESRYGAGGPKPKGAAQRGGGKPKRSGSKPRSGSGAPSGAKVYSAGGGRSSGRSRRAPGPARRAA